jgi:OmpA-OmpF porin, OOP family
MKMPVLAAASISALGLALSAPSFGQQTPGASAPDGWTMPYQRGFWGHAGVSVGRGELDAPCPAGASCDDKDQTFRAYAGGRFNNAIGLEVGALNFGEFDRGGGETDGWGLDFALIAGVPIGANSAVFGKLGAVYARTEVTGTAPGLRTGKERGWGPRWGIGGQVGLTPQWALRADWDRYRLALPGSKEDLDTLTIGAQYTFR